MANNVVCDHRSDLGLHCLPRLAVNPLNTDTRYNDKIRYSAALTDKKPSLKGRHLIGNYARILYFIFQKTYVLDIC